MPLPTLTGWSSTRDALHRAARVLGALRVASVDAQPNELHRSLSLIPGGVSTGRLGAGATLSLDFATAEVRCTEKHRSRFAVPLIGQSQTSLLDTL